jgi:hypothetical protein
MRWRRGEAEQVRVDCSCSGVRRMRELGGASSVVALAWLILVCVVGLAVARRADAESCPNAAFRSGVSASLPDCRAYELVTPVDKGRTQDLTFSNGAERAAVADDGERVALSATVPFGPDPSPVGARAIFSRNLTSGWEMRSLEASEDSAHDIEMSLFSPDLSQIAFTWETGLNFAETSHDVTFEAGSNGGASALLASVPREEAQGGFLGASANFNSILFASTDHGLLSTPTGTDVHAYDLYDWTGEHLKLVNVKSGPLTNQCGALLGGTKTLETYDFSAINAVSADGSKIFFTSPAPLPESSGVGCEEPTRLFMRVNGERTVEVSAPELGVHLAPSELLPVRYNYATPDGSKVFFNTETALTSDDTSTVNKLFEYNTEAPEGQRLRRIASGVPTTYGVGFEKGKGLFFSEDGSTVYVEPEPSGGVREIYRVETNTGTSSPVAAAQEQTDATGPSYSTPNGAFFLFGSEGVVDEPRGTGHDELYRYDHANGSVMCVTCGVGYAPALGEVILPGTVFDAPDDTPALTPMTEDGQEVFFQTTARLVRQDTNSTEEEFGRHPGLDVYEWEADGTGGCKLVQGCTYLLSSGEASGPSTFLGASSDGSNVFFATPARLVPQDTDEFDDIYDARVDGGFAPSPPTIECLSCQGVGNPPPLFSVPASESFVGTGNTDTHVAEKPKLTKKRPKKRSRAKGKWRRRRTSRAAYSGSVRATRRGI